MIRKILDLHIHSRYSRACSKDLVLPNIAKACEKHGIDIAATGDFTHPAWSTHLSEELAEDTDGIFRLKHVSSPTRFIIGTEVASIKKHAGETRRVHHLIFAPSLSAAKRFNEVLEKRGCNLRADGRPILGLTSKELLEVALGIDERMKLIPAHAWTPWFGIFGSKGGYDSLEEAFEDLTPHVHAIETGLSSDPYMNRRLSALDHITLISNSDAHSSAKLGREANVFSFANEEEVTYGEIMRIIDTGDEKNFLYTVEFYPEEGKYHLDGHRDCKIVSTPEETKRWGGRCPVCKRQLTIGVMNRVDELADRTEAGAKKASRIPHRSLVPLTEIIADTFEIGVVSKKVKTEYERMIEALGSEFAILLDVPVAAIAGAGFPETARAIDRVRQGRIMVQPGYDGVFGVVKVFAEGESRGRAKQSALDFD